MNKENIICWDCKARSFKCYELDMYRHRIPDNDFEKGEVTKCPITDTENQCRFCGEKARIQYMNDYLCNGCYWEYCDRSPSDYE